MFGESSMQLPNQSREQRRERERNAGKRYQRPTPRFVLNQEKVPADTEVEIRSHHGPGQIESSGRQAPQHVEQSGVRSRLGDDAEKPTQA